jgi:uncharacterized repeat protein (TIGR03803 family)
LYGTTFAGANNGFIYKIQTNGNAFAIIKEFTQNNLTEGSGPRCLIISGSTLYGGTDGGGMSSSGTLFRMNSNGGDFVVLKSFGGWDGNGPLALALGGTALYGVTVYGGTANGGVLFKINTDGSGYTVLRSFKGSDGARPCSLLLSGTTLYGTTFAGGSSDNGTIFSVLNDGTGYTVLRSLAQEDGVFALGQILLSGFTLYGTAEGGGLYGGGTVFKIGTDGSGFTVLHSFAAPNITPKAGLVMLGNILFGTTASGPIGGEDAAAIFKLDTNGNSFAVLQTNNPTQGILPWSTMCLAGSWLYGMTEFGGSNVIGHGVVFRLSFAPPTVLASPSSQTVELGGSVNFRVSASGVPPLSYWWFFNNTNLVGCSTVCSLRLPNVQFSQSGLYIVVVSNDFASTASAPAILQVIAPVERRSVPAINLLGSAGSALMVDYADSMAPAPSWQLLDTVILVSTSQLYIDATAPPPLQRFYRVRQTGAQVVIPSLNPPYMVPAITLTGNIGDLLRIDCINAVGPTDAWWMLDTVTLTNTSQLYFDTSGIGQPRRLYRLVPAP